jgi:hypothetical protein
MLKPTHINKERNCSPLLALYLNLAVVTITVGGGCGAVTLMCVLRVYRCLGRFTPSARRNESPKPRPRFRDFCVYRFI